MMHMRSTLNIDEHLIEEARRLDRNQGKDGAGHAPAWRH